ncbi:hypothetical protein RB595_000618 [Gaeumannomyces hyphopodioides]
MKPPPPATTAALLGGLAAFWAGLATAQQPPPPGIFTLGAVKMACPPAHVIAARETTAPAGFGTADDLVGLILAAIPGATAEAVDYPAAGGALYAQSVTAGIAAVLGRLTTFSSQCPGTRVVLHGYSQGGQVVDDVLCGGPDGASLPAGVGGLVQPGVAAMVAAAVMMGSPRHNEGIAFNRGNATKPGFAARAANFTCPTFEDRIQSYCDDPDPFCAKGNSTAYHQMYGKIYGREALQFVLDRLSR